MGVVALVLVALLAGGLGAAIALVAKNAEVARLKAELGHAADMARMERENAAALQAQWAKRLADERDSSARLRAESDKQWQLKLDAIKSELLQAAAQQMTRHDASLRDSNKSSIADLFAPIKEQLEHFRKSVEDSRLEGESNKKDIKNTFESTLRLFQQQQELAVRQLREETAKIGNDAVNLAQALKFNTKKQGNWGEMVLKTMLENSGLILGEHYFEQPRYSTPRGDLIPDFVVKFPEGRSLIIDSKVSLVAYTKYFETDDEDEQSQLLKAHLASVKQHVVELSEKDYPRVVADSLDYVMMFIPNESSYVVAVKQDPDLLRYAYERKVLIVSPNNLLMALMLAYNMWQNDRQVKNIERIVDHATKLYEKAANFQSSFNDLGDLIARLRTAYDKSSSQLATGRGNLISHCEKFRQMGITPKKRLTLPDEEGPN